MKKILAGLFLGMMLWVSSAWAFDPDIEGWITKIETSQRRITVLNELKNKIGLREYRFTVKNGTINDYKRDDRVRVWLDPDDRTHAAEVEILSA